MNESHKLPGQDSSSSFNNNGYNPDWASMARLWVELQNQRTNSMDPSSQVSDGTNETINIARPSQLPPAPPSSIDVNNLIPSYSAQYDIYLQQQIMQQQLLVAAHLASSNHTINPPMSQYMLPDFSLFGLSYNHHMMSYNQAGAQYSQTGHPYGIQENISSVLEETPTVPFKACNQPTLNVSQNSHLEANTSRDDQHRKSSETKEQSQSIESGLNSESLHCQTTTATISAIKQVEKRTLEPYKKQPIAVMTINRSSTSQITSKPASKIPQWIREGLERIERERARKLEKERLEAIEKELDDGSPTHTQESPIEYGRTSPDLQEFRLPNDESIDEVEVCVKNALDPMSKEFTAILSKSQTFENSVGLPIISLEQPDQLKSVNFIAEEDDEDDEDNDEMLNNALRQEMTRLLLEVTNQLIKSTCSDMYNSMKRSAVIQTSAEKDDPSDGKGRVVLKDEEKTLMQSSKPLGHLVGYEYSSSDDESDCEAAGTEFVQGKPKNQSSPGDQISKGASGSRIDGISISSEIASSNQTKSDSSLDKPRSSREVGREFVSRDRDRKDRKRSRSRSRSRNRRRSRSSGRHREDKRKNRSRDRRNSHVGDRSKNSTDRGRPRSRGSPKRRQDHRGSNNSSKRDGKSYHESRRRSRDRKRSRNRS